jgi:quinol monooxygenase YgiN
MTLTLAILEAGPEHAQHVKLALEEMIEEAAREDPELGRYELYESEDESNVFVIQQEVDVVEERLHILSTERLMELGTALREELRGPIRVQHMRLVRSLSPR